MVVTVLKGLLFPSLLLHSENLGFPENFKKVRLCSPFPKPSILRQNSSITFLSIAVLVWTVLVA
jgi:hypothetical protein